MASEFSEAETKTLTCVLDAIIPPSPDGKLPGAGELGLVELVAEAALKSPELKPAIHEGLSTLEELSGGRSSGGFCALTKNEKAEVLGELATTSPAFLPGLTVQTYLGYYQHPRILEGLGVPGRPPHPKGYELEVGDLDLLDPVRARPRLYRK